jgi:uncharacterized protein (DUF1778 family)
VLLLFRDMPKSAGVPHRRPKAKRANKLVIYLSGPENRLVEKAASQCGRSKSAFGADAVIEAAKKLAIRNHT